MPANYFPALKLVYWKLYHMNGASIINASCRKSKFDALIRNISSRWLTMSSVLLIQIAVIYRRRDGDLSLSIGFIPLTIIFIIPHNNTLKLIEEVTLHVILVPRSNQNVTTYMTCFLLLQIITSPIDKIKK